MERNIRIPWWAKMLAKIVLSRTHLPYTVWRRISFFKHGDMAAPAYAQQVFNKHFTAADFRRKNESFVAMEIGPGDSLFSAVIAAAYGACRTYLIDAGRFASAGASGYFSLGELLEADGRKPPAIRGMTTVDEIVSACNGVYGTKGLNSLSEIPSGSVDFIWSHAVLEHIGKAEFGDYMKQLRRVLRDDGCASHTVDLMDHLGGNLNNLRFSERVWESRFMARSGFYTNRLRFSEMLELFRKAGFSVEVTKVTRWPTLPTPRRCLSRPFRDWPEDDLGVSGFDVVLKPCGPLQDGLGRSAGQRINE
ncbi:MAG: methyltransferase domain-containing protein [Gammaproteobacteria bacterium]